MAEIPEEDLEETRAALAPTLAATAAILPWLAKPRPLRFDSALNERWIAACRRLSTAWSDRHQSGGADLRPAIFALYGIALETADVDCLRLGEALASAADRLDTDSLPPRLVAALTATVECLNEPGGLEHEAFSTRAGHFAQRLESTAILPADDSQRSAILDHLFVEECRERIEQMHDALAALPPDAYALKSEADLIAHQAELLELYGIMDLARRLAAAITGEIDLDNEAARQRVAGGLEQLLKAIATLGP